MCIAQPAQPGQLVTQLLQRCCRINSTYVSCYYCRFVTCCTHTTADAICMCLHAGSLLLCQAEASRGVGQQVKSATKREQAVAGTAAASTPAPTAPVKAASGAATAGPDPSSYSSVMAGTSYSKLGKHLQCDSLSACMRRSASTKISSWAHACSAACSCLRHTRVNKRGTIYQSL
jgi:hypothetical protein